jgi:hypothetical protein
MQAIPVALLDNRFVDDILVRRTFAFALDRQDPGPRLPAEASGFTIFANHFTQPSPREVRSIFILVVNRLMQPLTIATDLAKGEGALYGHWEAAPTYINFDLRHRHNVSVGSDNQIPAASKSDNLAGVGALVLVQDAAFATVNRTVGGAFALQSSDPNLEDTIWIACQRTTDAPLHLHPVLGSVALTNDPGGFKDQREFYDKQCDSKRASYTEVALKKGEGDDPAHAYKICAGTALLPETQVTPGVPLGQMQVVITVE